MKYSWNRCVLKNLHVINFQIPITVKGKVETDESEGRVGEAKFLWPSHGFTGFNIAAYVLLQIAHIVTCSCWGKNALTGG